MKVLIKSRNVEGQVIESTSMHYLVQVGDEVDWYMKWEVKEINEALCPHCVYFHLAPERCSRLALRFNGDYRTQCDYYAVSISRELGSGYSDRSLDPNPLDPNSQTLTESDRLDPNRDPNSLDPNLPQPGNYERKKIKGNYYLYWRWWEGKTRHSKYLGLNDPPNNIVTLEQALAWSGISLADLTDAQVTLQGFLNDGTTFKRVTKAVTYEAIRDYFNKPLLAVRAYLPYKADASTVARLPWMHINEIQEGITVLNGYKRQS